MIDKLKSILKAIGRKLGLFMTSIEKKRKEKFFASVRTSERTDKDGRKFLMVEEIDHPDYRYGDFRDEINDVEKVKNRR